MRTPSILSTYVSKPALMNVHLLPSGVLNNSQSTTTWMDWRSKRWVGPGPHAEICEDFTGGGSSLSHESPTDYNGIKGAVLERSPHSSNSGLLGSVSLDRLRPAPGWLKSLDH